MFSRGDGSPLVCYGMEKNGFDMPDWINFNPQSRTFYGTADELQTIYLELSCMHPESGSFKSIKFSVTVVINNEPMTHVF